MKQKTDIADLYLEFEDALTAVLAEKDFDLSQGPPIRPEEAQQAAR